MTGPSAWRWSIAVGPVCPCGDVRCSDWRAPFVACPAEGVGSRKFSEELGRSLLSLVPLPSEVVLICERLRANFARKLRFASRHNCVRALPD